MFQLGTVTILAAVYIHGTAALQVTSPTADSIWNLSEGNTITWSTVSTDPSTFNVVLVNNNANCAPTGTIQSIKENVSTADGKYQLSGLQGLKECSGYQINLVSTSNNGILAQSAPFNYSSSAQGSQPISNVNTSEIQPLNGTNSTQLGTNVTTLGTTFNNKTISATNATSKLSNSTALNSTKVSPQGESAIGTASMLSLSSGTLPAFFLLSISSLII